MKKIIYIFIAFLLLTACNSQKINTSAENPLNGKWNWVSSSGGFAGKTHTPESENKTITIEITNSAIRKYENGKLLSENKYSIKTQNSIFGGERKMIVPDNDMPKQSFEIKDNKLYLSEECNDCFQSEYIRVK